MKDQRGLKALWAAQALSTLGTCISYIAVMTFVVRLGGGPVELGISGLARLIPAVVMGPLAGAIIDRLDKRHVVIIADVLLSGLMLSLVWATEVWQVYGVNFACGVVAMFSQPSRQSIVPALARSRERLVRWNAIISTTENVAFSVGPAIGGVIVGLAGPRPAFVVDAATFIGSALILSLLPRLVTARERGGQAGGVYHDLVAGIGYIRRERALTLLAVTSAAVVFGAMMANVLLVLYVTEILRAGPATYGLFMSLLGGGSALGALITPALSRRLSFYHMYTGALAVIGCGFIVLGAWPVVFIAGAVHLLRGTAVGVANVSVQTIMGLQVDESMRGRAFAFYRALNLTARAASMGLAGMLAAVMGIPLLFITAGAVVGAATTAFALGRRRRDRRPDVAVAP